MARFELLANVFFAQLKSVPNHCNHDQDIVHSIVCLPLYEPIYKLLNNNSDFQVYIATSAQAIAKKEICKLTFNTALKLLIKAMNLTYLETFNMVAIDKEY